MNVCFAFGELNEAYVTTPMHRQYSKQIKVYIYRQFLGSVTANVGCLIIAHTFTVHVQSV